MKHLNGFLPLLAIGLTLPWSVAMASENVPALPGTKKDLKFDRKVARLDLEDVKKYKFFFKTGGTSIGFKIAKTGKGKRGQFLPENSAHKVEADVVTYRVSRLLGVSPLFNPSAHYTLGPKATARFRSMLRRNEKNRWRRFNTNNLLKRFRKNSQQIAGSYRYRHKRKSQSVDVLIRNNSFKTAHPFAKFLLGSGPMPSTKPMSFKKIRRDKKHYPKPLESGRELARQLSTIFVMDMLMGQWDRFSGGNIEAYAHKNGRLQFVSRDNGGATLSAGWVWFERYQKWVTRFDRPFVKKLRALNAFLQGRTDHYGEFTDPGQIKIVAGFKRDSSFAGFKRRLQRLTEKHIPEAEKRYGKKAYFPRISGQSAYGVSGQTQETL